jgi:pimeloyl-ACP methyl ester carboxylesterase
MASTQEKKMAEWSKGFVEANGLETFYYRTGADSGKPPVILLHGYTDNALCWLRMARGLEDKYDLILPDARGHGRTRGEIGDLSPTRLGSDAVAISSALGLTAPILFGHSMGAITALAAAADNPTFARAIVLEDPPFIDAPPTITPEIEQQLEEGKRQSLAFHALPLEEKLARGRKDNPNWSEDEIWPWAESKSEYDPDIVNHRTSIAAYDWRGALKRVTCPMHLITAETAKWAIISPVVAEEAHQLNSLLEVAYIEGAGHCIHRDRYAETLHSVTAFLSRVTQMVP